MSDYALSQNSLATLTTISATATSAAIIAAPAAGSSLIVRHISYHAATTTTNRMVFSILGSAGSNAFTRSVLASGDTGEINILGGWMLGTGAGLYLAMSATSTPSINLSVIADVVNRAL